MTYHDNRENFGFFRTTPPFRSNSWPAKAGIVKFNGSIEPLGFVPLTHGGAIVNRVGKLAVPMNYGAITEFTQGRAIVRMGSRFGVLKAIVGDFTRTAGS